MDDDVLLDHIVVSLIITNPKHASSKLHAENCKYPAKTNLIFDLM